MKTPKAQSAKQVSYTHRRRLSQPMADVVQRVREALAVEGPDRVGLVGPDHQRHVDHRRLRGGGIGGQSVDQAAVRVVEVLRPGARNLGREQCCR